MSAPRYSLVAVLLLFGLVMSCSTDAVDPSAGSQGSAADSDAVADDITLPIDFYGYTALEIGQVILARELLTGDCMHRLGVRPEAEPDRRSLEQDTQSRIDDFGFYGNKRRYGVTRMDVAATYGYHLPSTVNDASGTPAEGEKEPPSPTGSESAEDLALSGPGSDGQHPANVNGHPVPPGGCRGEAVGIIAGTGALGNAGLVRTIAWESYDHALQDPTLADALEQWSSCMKTKGYDFSSPLVTSSTFDIDERTVTQKEIETAMADVDCKQQTRLVDTWRDIEGIYQKNKISENGRQLDEIKEERDLCMERVTEIIARP